MSDIEDYSARNSEYDDEIMEDTESESYADDDWEQDPHDNRYNNDRADNNEVDAEWGGNDNNTDPYMTMSGGEETTGWDDSSYMVDQTSDTSSQPKSYRRSVVGGVKVSKKAKVDPLYLQRLIDKDLRERISIDAFKQDKIVTMIKNTVNIKCKACGSDNVFVESKQVRSADEAMTKFYTCLNCGNKWRFD